jgi:hypothetical protein
VTETYTFEPPRRLGTIVHLVAIAVLLAGGSWGLWRAVNASVGLVFLLFLLPFLLAVFLVPLLAYRLYVLHFSSYVLARDYLRLRWGLRLETLAMAEVIWVRPADELARKLPLPWLRWPGSVMGQRRLPNGMVVEFMASRSSRLLLLAGAEGLFAISPADPAAFLQAYRRLNELGSLSPPPPQSIYPTFLLARVWEARPTRFLLISGALLSLALLAWASLAAPSLESVSLGFAASGTPRPPIPGIRLMLFPVLNSFFFFVNSLLGLFLFRRDENRPLAYLLWASSVLVTILFLIATSIVLRIS